MEGTQILYCTLKVPAYQIYESRYAKGLDRNTDAMDDGLLGVRYKSEKIQS